MNIVTADRKIVHQGDRVYNYYDGEWGIIASEPDREGWFDFTDDNDRTKTLNGERITSLRPLR